MILYHWFCGVCKRSAGITENKRPPVCCGAPMIYWYAEMAGRIR